MADNKQGTPPPKAVRLDPANKYLPTETAAAYEIVGWKGGPEQNFGRLGNINLEKLGLQRANSLVMKGFKKIKRK